MLSRSVRPQNGHSAAVEADLVAAARPEVEAVAQEIRITQAVMAKAEQKAATDKPGDARADAEAARAKLLELGEVPELPRMLMRDVTLEALAKRMAEQSGRIGSLASEGGLFKVAAGLYGAGGKANTDLLFEAYTGSPYTIDRAGRPALHMPHTFLALGLIVQPGVVAGLERANPEFRDSGLLGRFLYARPAPGGADTFDSPPVPEPVADAYAARIGALVEQVWRSETVQDLELSADARALFAEFYNAFGARRKPGGDLHEIADWAGKLRGQLIRVAACLTLYEDPTARTISGPGMANALGLAPYFIAHAKATFDLMSRDSEGTLRPLRDLLAWLRTRPDPAAVFTAREAWQALKGRSWAQDMDAMADTLTALEDYGWIALVPLVEVPGKRGRKPSPRYEPHPWIAVPPQSSTAARPLRAA
ncbi:DUF3987 domain-containing protein [Streptomyces noursei]|uniref:DUF3987 domain-containing protein n=1 Tax=Streptomyces noursei TaxID=1971 RepID=UPI0030B80F34